MVIIGRSGQWRLGGINRGVYLYSTDQKRIQDFFSVSDLDNKYKDGVFSVDVDIKNHSKNTISQTLEVNIIDQAGKKVFAQSKKISLTTDKLEKVSLGGGIKNPLKWTAETPNLYHMLITLNDTQNKII